MRRPTAQYRNNVPFGTPRRSTRPPRTNKHEVGGVSAIPVCCNIRKMDDSHFNVNKKNEVVQFIRSRGDDIPNSNNQLITWLIISFGLDKI